MVLIHVLTVVGLILTPLPGWRVFAVAYVLHFLGGLGTTVAYHRAIAHKSVKLHPVVRNVLTFFAMFNGSGSPLSWAAYHRLHHAKSDTPEDISSPRVGGFWWSHLRWLWQAGGPPIQKYCKEIDRPDVPGLGEACRSRSWRCRSSAGCRSAGPRSSGLDRCVWSGRCTRSASSTASATCGPTRAPTRGRQRTCAGCR